MKKLLPCRLLTTLLLFVAFFATGNLSAQCDANATPRFVCAGPSNNIIYTTASVNVPNGTILTWTIVGDSTGGATFLSTGLSTPTTTIAAGLLNSIVVHLGSLPGSVEVRMSIPGDPPGTGCAASVTSKIVVVQGSATPVVCHDDPTTVSIIPELTGTKLSATGPIIQFPSLPGGCGQYTYDLVTSPGGVIVATNNTGVFPNAIPQDYVIRIRDCDGCSNTSPVITVINPPFNPVHVSCPLPKVVKSCDYTTQQEINDLYDAWYQGFQYSGGTQPITVVRTGATDYPRLCGDVKTASIDATDYCKTHDFCASTFTVTPPDPVLPPTIIDKEVKACDVTDLAKLAALIAEYEGTIKATGGCKPVVTWDPYIAPEKLCNTTINLVGHITDRCEVNLPLLAHLVILPPTPVGYNAPQNENKPACFYKDNTEVVNAYGAWFHQFTIVPGTGCDPQIKLDQGPVPDFCGGTTSVTATITDKCIDPIVITRFFSIDKPGDWVIKNCPGDVKLGCNPKPEEFPEVITLTTDSQCPTTQEVKDVTTHTDCFYTLTRTYTVKTSCDLVGKTCVQKVTYKIDLDAPIITGTEHTTVPGGDEDSGLCSPTTTIGGPSINAPKTNGSTGVAIDFGQIRTGDAPAETLSWTNGTTTAQSEYFEGMGVPQRLILSGLKKGKHTMVISHEAIKKQDASRHGYDFFMSWEQAIATGENIGNGTRSELKNLIAQKCDGNWSGAGQALCNGFTTTTKTDLPDVMGNPPSQTGIANVDDVIKCFEGIYGNRQIEINANAAVSGFSVKFLGYTGRDGGDNLAYYEITWTSDSPAVGFKFAGRMAMGGGTCGYGNCHGAGSIKGNPYHIRLEGIDGASPGSRDNQTKCKPSQTCDVNIPVKFKTPIASDCDPIAPVVTPDGTETITTNADGSVTHCQKWIATDACGNVAHDESCITVVCALGANFGDLHISKLTGYVSPTSKSIYDNIGREDVAITKFVAYPNPFRNSVSLSLDTSSTERVNLSVYDMLGKQLDQRVTTPGEINTLQLGGEYPTGIYNLILNQATEQRTIRLLKQ